MRRMGVAITTETRVRVEERLKTGPLCTLCSRQVRSAARSAFATICGGPAPASPQGPLGARVRFFRTSPILA